MADVFRAPIISPRKDGPARASAFDPPNILLGLLSVLPFHATDFPTPKPVAYLHQEFDPPNLLLKTLSPTVPFFDPHWASATSYRAAPAPFDQPNLLVSTLAPVVAATPPFVVTITPSPAFASARPMQFDPPNLILTTLTPTTPFRGFFEPNPYIMPSKAAAFDPPFPSQPPAADVPPTDGHWLPPTHKELERIRRETAKAQARQEAEWEQAVKDKETLHAQIMASLHPEKALGIPLLGETVITAEDDDDEDDVAILLLYG